MPDKTPPPQAQNLVQRVVRGILQRIDRLAEGGDVIVVSCDYVEPHDAKVLLDAAVAQLRGEIGELEKRIKEAESAQNRRLARELARRREYVAALLEAFKKYVERPCQT
jgi:ribosomal protein L18E